MEEQVEAIMDWDAVEDLKTRRGYYGTAHSDQTSTILVHAPVEQVAEAIVQLNPTAEWEADVLNRSISISQQGLLIYRIQGHTWSQIIYVMCELQHIPNVIRNNFPQKLSAHLGSQVVNYSNDDTVCYSNFELFNYGESQVTISIGPDGLNSLNKERQIDEQFKTLDALEVTLRPSDFFAGNYCKNEVVKVRLREDKFYDAEGVFRKMVYPIERVDYIRLV